MNLSWNEIRQRARRFAHAWGTASSEAAEKQTFWNEFFEVFGMRLRTVAAFEEPVRHLHAKDSYRYGRIDLFWRGTLLVEHKSRGGNLAKAESQAFQYVQDLLAEGREDEVPRFVIVSDFARFALYDLEPEDQAQPGPSDLSRGIPLEFPLADLHEHVRAFAFIVGQKPVRLDPEDPANEAACKIMTDLHDRLKAGGFAGHGLEQFLVRILFCLFAEDGGVFEPFALEHYLKQHTREDGSDLGAQLNRLFAVLDTPEDRRQQNLDEDLAGFPYVNGALFGERLDFADFNRDMRAQLLACCGFRWERISPAVFGALFQGTMDPRERRQSGGHYTSEQNILKVVRSLFLDELRAELAEIKAARSSRQRRLQAFHAKLRHLTFLDPACGCGNFLVITYRELRRLELEVLSELYPQAAALDVRQVCVVDVDQFYGIEILEWPVRIAEVALWLMDHQMNVEVAAAFGQNFRRLPLKSSPHIVCANALRLDWREVLPPAQCSFVLGNPPFVGKKARNAEQQADLKLVFGSSAGTGVLDYVSCWYLRAAHYMRDTSIRAAFVSTNSLTQGEQPGVLWAVLCQRFGAKIHFAHRTFVWESETRGRAHVHVVIIGFATFDTSGKRLYDYEADSRKASVGRAANISPYLVAGPDAALLNRAKPICPVPEIQFGNMPNDDGQFLLTDPDREELLRAEPEAAAFIRPFLSAKEYLHGIKRWCLWLQGASPRDLRNLSRVRERVEAVRKYRAASARPTTRQLADYPSLFGEIRQPDAPFVLIPRHSSESRRYIPFSYFTPDHIVADSCLFVPDATPYHFGVLSSAMHMAWVRQVCGRLKSDYRYSNKLVYNNYPWPEGPTAKQQVAVETAAQAVLEARQRLAGNTLADLYDPLAMPPELVRAHAALDRAVDRCYRTQPFGSDRQRVEFLFALYEQLTAPLVPAARRRRQG